MSVKKMVFIAISAAMIIAAKEALSFLPNVELVTFFLMVYAVIFPLDICIPVCIVFVLVQLMLYGLGIWNIFYFYIWPLITIITYALRKTISKKTDYMALLSGFFGITFGTMSGLITLVYGGWTMFVAYVSNGLVFDIIHMGGNYVLMMLLYQPVKKQLEKLQSKYQW